MARLQKMREKKVSAIISALNQGDSLCKQFLDPKQDDIKRLRAEQRLLAETIGMYITKRQQIENSNHNEIFVRNNLARLNEQLVSLEEIFLEFLKKFLKVEKSFLEHEDKIRRQLSSLEESLRKVKAAKRLRELGKVVVPSSFKRTHFIPKSVLKKLVKEWDNMNLQIKMADLVCQLIFLE